MTRAIPFVTESEGTLRVNPAAAAFLKTVAPPFGVVVVAGVYRSGKSFLLNRGVLRVTGKGRGFDTGNSINACTKGIWLYPEVVEDSGRRLLVLDTEGTRSLTASSEADSRLVSLSLLLSSAFVYNSVGSIDESALSALGVFAAVSRSVAAADPGKHQAPDLLWVLRDFHLHVQSEEGAPMSQDEYLEQALRAKEDDDMRATVMDQFPSRKLWTMVRPVDKEAELGKLESLPDGKLRPEFVEQLGGFRKTLFERAPTKCIGATPVGGQVYLEVCEHLCQRINEGHAPSVLDAYGFLVENEVLCFSLDLEKASSAAQERISASFPVPPARLKEMVASAMGAIAEKPSSTAESKRRTSDLLTLKVEELAACLSPKNDDAGMKWVRRAKAECERSAETPLAFLRLHLESSVAAVGASLTLGTLPLFLDIVLERITKTEAASTAGAVAAREEASHSASKLERAEKECTSLRNALEGEILKMGSSTHMVKEEYDSLEAVVAEKTQRVAQLESEMEELTKRLHVRPGAGEEEEVGLPAAATDMASSPDASARVHSLTFKLRDAEERLEIAKEQLVVSETEQKEELERSMRGLRESATAAENEHTRVSAELAAALEDFRARHGSLSAEMDAAKFGLSAKSEELDAARARIVEQSKLHDDEAERARAESMEKFRLGVSSVSAGVEDVRRELTETRSRALAAECGRAQSEGSATNLKRRLSEADSEITELKRYRAELETAKRANTELSISNRSLEVLAEELRSRCMQLESGRREIHKDISASERRHAVEIARLEIMLGAHGAQPSGAK
jgi:cell division protein FtsL